MSNSPLPSALQFDDPDFPRPSLRRAGPWWSLDGEWEFEMDHARRGLAAEWQKRPALDGTIRVPFAHQAPLSGIGSNEVCDWVWQARKFNLPRAPKPDERVLLHFGAVDYSCRVWVNGREAGGHRGGHVPFALDVTALVKERGNRVVLWVEDLMRADQPRGKQHLKPEPESIFYQRTTGIWQTVWLEIAPAGRVTRFALWPRAQRGEIEVRAFVTGLRSPSPVRGRVMLGGAEVAAFRGEARLGLFECTVKIPEAQLWSPASPVLYTVELTLEESGDVSRVETGLRDIEIAGSKVLLNGEPLFQRLILDQGYWPDGLMTAPSPAALRRDIELTQAMGFNGCRKHQKIEDPRFLYWADRMGFLVWDEMPSAFEYSAALEEPFLEEMRAMIRRDVNHPCVVAWTPFNESWGIAPGDDPRTQALVRRAVAEIRALDATRPISDNDGWLHVETDLATIHDYSHDESYWAARAREYARGDFSQWCLAHSEQKLKMFVEGEEYAGQPVIVSECGGVGLAEKKNSEEKAWGYDGVHHDADAARRMIADTMRHLTPENGLAGYCYTQLSDVVYEINGLLTYDRREKFNAENLRKIFGE